MLLVKRGRPRQVVICGRKQCTKCTRFRHVVDFAVDRWDDLAKTKPRSFRPTCRTCVERRRREIYHSRPYEERTKQGRQQVERLREAHVDPRLAERRAVNLLVREMSKPDRYLYQMEGALPLGIWSVADEDHDPTPVPKGCPSCYLQGGHPCDTCPDVDVRARVREARKKGLIVGDPSVGAWGAAMAALHS